MVPWLVKKGIGSREDAEKEEPGRLLQLCSGKTGVIDKKNDHQACLFVLRLGNGKTP